MTFKLNSSNELTQLNSNLECYTHKTGAVHYHISNDDSHKSFMVGFRTHPTDDIGLPHILEHTVLCGSKKYPVRDPFFMMIRRSLQTFMNAMTADDMTLYPFSSQNDKDFDNLLSVYLDSTFSPNLHPLDVLQEGCRLEEHDGKWSLHGVVYNEMKGATAEPDRILGEIMTTKLLPDTCYAYNAGGEPSAVPFVTREMLVDFHKKYYNPSNACFVTYGDMDVKETQNKFEEYLKEEGEKTPPQELQKPFDTPVSHDIEIPKQEGEKNERAVLAWSFGDTANAKENLLGDFLEEFLIGYASAPLRMAIEQSGLCDSMAGSGYCAYERNGLFEISAKGMKAEDFEKFEALVFDTLEDIKNTSVDKETIEMVLHQLELSSKRITGASYPFGLELAEKVLMAWKSGVSPLPFIDSDEIIKEISKEMLVEGAIAKEIEKRFIKNNHRVFIKSKSDEKLLDKWQNQEDETIEAMTKDLSDTDKESIKQKQKDLKVRQEEEDDKSVLPDFSVSDIASKRKWSSYDIINDTFVAKAGTNGISHQVVAIELNDVSEDDAFILGLLTGFIGRLGVGEKSYKEQSAFLNRYTGGVSSWTEWIDTKKCLFCLEVNGLNENAEIFIPVLKEILEKQRFDEEPRIKELLSQALRLKYDGILQQGHLIAFTAANETINGTAAMKFKNTGIGGLFKLKEEIKNSNENPNYFKELNEKLITFLKNIAKNKIRLAYVGDKAKELSEIGVKVWKDYDRVTDVMEVKKEQEKPSISGYIKKGYSIPTGVSYCAISFPVPRYSHEDSGALTVAAKYLTNNFVHTKLREQGGAYGGSTVYSSSDGTFGFISYRDPRIDGTIDDMKEALEYLVKEEISQEGLDEAIISSIAGIDKPSSPSGDARKRIMADLRQNGPDSIEEFRNKIISCTKEKLKEVAKKYLLNQEFNIAVLGAKDKIEESNLSLEKNEIDLNL